MIIALLSGLHIRMREHPFLAFCFFGVLGVLPDLDHLLEQNRFLHPFFAVVAGGLIVIGGGICLGSAYSLRLVGSVLNVPKRP